MTRYFTHYWTNQTWEDNRSVEKDNLLNHTASNLFTKRGVQSSDHVYVITVFKGELYLLGKLIIGAIGDADTIAPLLDSTPDDLWNAVDHLLAAQATPKPLISRFLCLSLNSCVFRAATHRNL